jgi:hypothetical protein
VGWQEDGRQQRRIWSDSMYPAIAHITNKIVVHVAAFRAEQ